MNINDTLFGFEVIRKRENPEVGGILWEMRHMATGARLAWLDNGESNKLFSIAFKTLPWNHTGVFHILEHSVLNGSREFPVKEPFVNLLKSSMNTFLNAMTFPDKTVFPVSSRNEQDFLNLTKVYLDAVFCPAIYENPNIFYQEGWHYELEEGGEPSYNGVVFNEMKGAFSSPDTQLNEALMGLLFPDTSYGYVSGGHPAHIPELSYEEFLGAHRDFYSPANCYVYLDGSVPLDKVLPMVDGYLSGCKHPGSAQAVTLQPTTAYREQTQYYQGEDGGDALLICGQRVASWQDRQTLMALSALSSYLTGSNEAPLKKAILESGIAQDAALFVEDSIAQPFAALQVRQMDGARKDELLALVRRFLSGHVIDKADLRATIDQMEFSIRDGEEPKGLMRNIFGLNTWLFGGDLLEGMTYDACFEGMRRGLETGYFEQLLQTLTFAGDNAATVLLLPSSRQGEQLRAEEAQRLRAAAARWTQADRQAILELNKKLALWQATPDSEEAVKTLPVLPIEQISSRVARISTGSGLLCGRPALYHKTASGGISHYGLYFSLGDRSIRELQVLSFLAELLGQLPTASHDLAQLQQLQKSTLGRLDCNVVTWQDRADADRCKPYFAVTFSALTAKEDQTLALVREILTETDLGADAAREWIHILAAQGREALQQSIIAGGNRFAALRSGSHLFAASAVAEQTEGYSFYRWLKELDEHFDSRIEGLQAELTALAATVFCRNRVMVSVASAGESRGMEAFLNSLDAGEPCAEVLTHEPDRVPAQEAILIPAQVSYAAASGRCQAPYGGIMDLLAGILNYDHLWSEVRVKGGAYGCGFRTSSGGNISFTSFRDPSPCNSMAVFADAGDFIQGFARENSDLTQYIIGAAASQEPLLHERVQAGQAVADHAMGITREQRDQWRRQLLAATPQDLADCAAWLRSAGYARCIVGCREALNDGIQRTVLEL